jgi:NAD(P)-dependent dehydrogenase (short-subunit alcohol dehydrogenase family)
MTGAFDLTGQVALITGGAGILGTRFASALAASRASVVVLDVDAARARSAADSLKASYAVQAAGLSADVADRAALEQVRVQIEREIGPVSVLVNAAAAKSRRFFDAFTSFPLEDWDEVMRTNVTGAMIACQIFGSRMAERRSGSIINILSIYGIVAPDQRIYEGSLYEGRPINTPAVYSTSKAALWGLTKYLAAYWGAEGVRVNAVTPGGVFSGQNDTFVQRYSHRVPLGRMAEADEIAGAVVFLASSASSYVTGQNIIVDGGLSVW